MLALGYNFWSEWELQEKVDFDGVNKLIIVYSHVTNLDIREDVWSAWIRWDYMLSRNYNRFPGAMERTGLDDTPDGQTGDMYFLVNGWRLVINLANVRVTGILYSRDFDTAYYTYELESQYPAKVSLLTTTTNSVENVITATKEEIATEVADYPMANVAHNFDTFAGSLIHLKHLQYTLFVNAEVSINGDGSQHRPYDNETDALDYAELHGITDLAIMSDIEVARNLKNLTINGIGTPKVEFIDADLKNSKFHHCNLTGNYTSIITAQDCRLTGVFNLNGFFETCALNGEMIIPDGGDCYVTKCTAYEKVFVKPSVSVGGVDGTATGLFMGYKGGLSVRHCNQPTDIIKIVLDGGTVDFEATCTDGIIKLIGRGNVGINNAGAGCNIDYSQLLNNDGVSQAVLNTVSS